MKVVSLGIKASGGDPAGVAGSVFRRGTGFQSFRPALFAGRPNFRNPFDVRQAHVSLSNKDGAFELQLGRQELTFGAERLAGVSHWNNFPRTFDALKGRFRHREFVSQCIRFSRNCALPAARG
jgi:hypothetical protein